MKRGWQSLISGLVESPWTVAAPAAVVRIIYLIQYASDPTFYVPLWDAEEYHQMAQALSKGSLPEDIAFRPPLYPLFLGTIYLLFGAGPFIPRIIQIVAGILTCLVVRSLARRLSGPSAGTIAGLVAAFSGMMVYFDLELLPTGLEALLLSLLIMQLIISGDGPAKINRIGLTFAAAALLRPTVLPLYPVALIWLWQRFGLRAAGRFSLTTLAPLALLMGLHIIAGHGAVLVSAQGGVNLYIGNHRSADGMTATLPGVGAGWSWETLSAIVAGPSGRSANAAEIDRHFIGLALAEFAADPVGRLKLMARKALLFFNRIEISNNKDIYYHASQHPIFGALMWLGFPLLLAPALAGIAAGWRSPEVRFLTVVMAIIAAVTVLFFVNARFRHPLLPLMIVLSVEWFRRIIRPIKGGRRKMLRPLAVPLAAFAAGALFLFAAESGINTRRHDYGLFSRGIALERLGRTDEAIKYYHAAIEANPRAPFVRFQLGEIERATGRYLDAIETYRQELAVNPHYAKGWNNLGVALVEVGDERGASEAFAQALKIAPGMVEAARNLARVNGRLGMRALEAGDYPNARKYLSIAVQLEPSNLLFATLLLKTRWLAGDTTGVRETLADIIARYPDFEPAQLMRQELLEGD